VNTEKATPIKANLPVWSDPERLGGRLCFKGTRVPVDALFENLEAGLNLEEYLNEFEGVTREQAVAVLEYARHSVDEPLHA
jgi:uncharacterized protein (DUF433 family)